VTVAVVGARAGAGAAKRSDDDAPFDKAKNLSLQKNRFFF